MKIRIDNLISYDLGNTYFCFSLCFIYSKNVIMWLHPVVQNSQYENFPFVFQCVEDDVAG